MEILPGVFQVEGVDPPGFSTHIYLLKDSGPTYTLIDTGLPGSDVPLFAYLAKQGIDPGAVRRVLITHLHLDHVGGLSKVIERTKARSFAHWVEAGYIAREPPYDGPGMPPVESVRIDEPLKDGDRIEAGGGLIAYHTPGHTPGHVVYYQPERKLLFPGDLLSVQEGQLAIGPVGYSLHPATMGLSLRRVRQLSVNAILTYHGGPVLAHAGSALRNVAGGA